MIHFAYRKSSLLNYAFVCSLLATSELAPKWSYHWILSRWSAEDASQQVDGHRLGAACPCRAGGLVTSLALQSLREISAASPQKTALNTRVPPESYWTELTRTSRLRWSSIKSLSVCTHACLRSIGGSCVKLIRIRAETEKWPLQNKGVDWKWFLVLKHFDMTTNKIVLCYYNWSIAQYMYTINTYFYAKHVVQCDFFEQQVMYESCLMIMYVIIAWY